MGQRSDRAEDAGVAEEDVDAAPALEGRRAQAIDAGVVLEVEWDQCCRTALGLDLVVEVFEATDGARDRDHMRAGGRQSHRRRPADAARGAGDHGHPAGEAAAVPTFSRHAVQPTSASFGNGRTLSLFSRSASRVG